MTSIPTRDYRQILSDVQSLQAYLTKLGLQRAPDRLQGIITNLKEIEQVRAQNQLASLNTHPRVAELVWSLVEAQELAEIFKGIEGYHPQTVKRLMQKALTGPLHPINETLTSNIARNTVFELTLATRLRRCGVCVTMGQQADLVVDYAGARLYIECKRPLYEHNIGRNIEKARSQLRRRFDAERQFSSVGGLVAISMSKAVNPGSNMFIVDKADDLKQMGNDVAHFHQQYGRDYNNQVDPRLIGILYQIYTPALARGDRHPLIAASHIEIFLADGSLRTVFPLTGEGLRQLLGSL
jgi:hypothetical protein